MTGEHARLKQSTVRAEEQQTSAPDDTTQRNATDKRGHGVVEGRSNGGHGPASGQRCADLTAGPSRQWAPPPTGAAVSAALPDGRETASTPVAALSFSSGQRVQGSRRQTTKAWGAGRTGGRTGDEVGAGRGGAHPRTRRSRGCSHSTACARRAVAPSHTRPRLETTAPLSGGRGCLAWGRVDGRPPAPLRAWAQHSG